MRWRISACLATAAVAAALVVSGQLRAVEPAGAQAGDAVTLFVPDTVHSNGADLRWSPYLGHRVRPLRDPPLGDGELHAVGVARC